MAFWNPVAKSTFGHHAGNFQSSEKYRNGMFLETPGCATLPMLSDSQQKWKSIDPFHIRCRYETPQGRVVKLDIQLYQVEVDSYLVDFKNGTPGLSGRPPDGAADYTSPRSSPTNLDADEDINLSAFAFFDACSKLITELAISA